MKQESSLEKGTSRFRKTLRYDVKPFFIINLCSKNKFIKRKSFEACSKVPSSGNVIFLSVQIDHLINQQQSTDADVSFSHQYQLVNEDNALLRKWTTYYLPFWVKKYNSDLNKHMELVFSFNLYDNGM